MNINMSSIMSKAKAFSESPEGKRRMKTCLEKYEKEGRTSTGAGDKLITEKMMLKAASKLIHMMKTTAASYNLPESVMKHFDSLKCSAPVKLNDGATVIYIYFEDDLHRDSLEDGSDYYGGKFGGYTGEGINNIIALFNNGANAKDYTYGWWNGHHATGDGVLRSGYDNDFAWTRSKKEREALHFIQQAVMDFNTSYGAVYGVTATEGAIYQ